jgi:hypothetical protein
MLRLDAAPSARAPLSKKSRRLMAAMRQGAQCKHASARSLAAVTGVGAAELARPTDCACTTPDPDCELLLPTAQAVRLAARTAAASELRRHERQTFNVYPWRVRKLGE